MADKDRVRDRLLAIIVGLLAVAALKWSYPVTMPLAAAAFVVAAAWPIKIRLDRSLPGWASYLGTVLVLLVICLGFVLALCMSVSQLVATLSQRRDQFEQLYMSFAGWASARGFSILDASEGYSRVLAVAQAVLAEVYAIAAYVGLVAILVLFGLREVAPAAGRLRESLPPGRGDQVLASAEEISVKLRDYIGVTTLTSLLTGAACAGWAAVMGLDLALLWGVLNFLLNFVPVIGNFVGIIPPTLYAMVQFGSWSDAAMVFAGYAAIQLVISNLVYPWMQSRGVSLSPAAVIVALVFWSWAWGVAGGLMAVPLTAAFVVVCARFRSTAWIARLLSRE